MKQNKKNSRRLKALQCLGLFLAMGIFAAQNVRAQEKDEPLVEQAIKSGMLTQVGVEVTIPPRFERTGANVVTAKGLSIWEDGVTYQTEVNAEGHLAVHVEMPIEADTENLADLEASLSRTDAQLTPDEQAALEEGLDWRTLFFYDYESRYLAQYDGFIVYLHNQTDDYLSVFVGIEEGADEVTAADDVTNEDVVSPDYAWLISEEQNGYEVVSADGNRFDIPAGFEGYFYLPFAEFGVAGVNPFGWSDTIGLSFYFPTESGDYEFTFGDLRLLRNSLATTQANLQTPGLEGEAYLILPKTGAVLEQYQANVLTQASGRPVEFALMKSYEGVTMSSEGILEIDVPKFVATTSKKTESNADGESGVDSIDILIRDQESGTFSRRTIQLQQLTVLNPALADLGVPLEEEVATFAADNFEQEERWLPGIRVVLVIASFAVVGLCLYWWETERRYRTENHRQLRAKRDSDG